MGGYSLRAVVAVGVLALMAPAAAAAATGTYAPVTPREPGLLGSEVSGRCADGVAVIDYAVQAVGAEGPLGPARLELTDGRSRATVPLPEVSADRLEGSVRWPGEDPRDDRLNWTTGDIRAELRVGELSLEVPLRYPESPCAAVAGDPLAVTGSSLPQPVLIGGVAAVVLGGVLAWGSRRRRRRVG
ncbi:hypothetical protein AB3M83_02930 [Microbacterium sp. 179-B 1A2 NHS]|uniref:hypothetical protein n=1 Tax=Microbacterium sp. 179-B 1A2 NHS TaxID=3142383 RepID=UPI0039A31D67